MYVINSVDKITLLYSPTDAAPHFLQKLTHFIDLALVLREPLSRWEKREKLHLEGHLAAQLQ